MGYKKSSKASQTEAKLQEAICAIRNKTISGPYAAAARFKVNYKTLCRRMAGGQSHSQAATSQQILSIAEEKSLIRWITRYTAAGTPILLLLLLEMAKLLRA